MSDVVESTVEILTALAASGSLQVEEIDSTAKAIYHPGSLPGAVGLGQGLPYGGPKLRRAAQSPGQVHWPGPVPQGYGQAAGCMIGRICPESGPTCGKTPSLVSPYRGGGKGHSTGLILP
jgi:hypothetical protein